MAPFLQFYQCLPEEYDGMQVYAELIPSSNHSAVDPWCGWVLNLNVMTRIHRDNGDVGLCADGVITSPDYVGGDLCLAQPGLILPLLNGDFSFFTSMSTDHFNLDYKGERCSYVFQTCKEFKSWEEDRHGWKDNKFMT